MNVHTPVRPDMDLSACAREPIHIPGSIQPHGLLLALDPERRLVHASRNLAHELGRPLAAMLGRNLDEVWPDLAAAVGDVLGQVSAQSAATHLRTIALTTALGVRTFDAAGHRCGSLTVVELEDVRSVLAVSLDALYPTLRSFTERLQQAPDIQGLLAATVSAVRELTGFDRVMVYRFDASWDGTVVAEDGNGVLPSYLDLRFPASDIPAQARELYRRNRLRIIPDAGYTPVPVEPAPNPRDGQPLDMSQSVLRSVSPVHLEYMRNMGTAASMSISVLRGTELWGLISCHSREKRLVPLQVRNACDFIGQIFSLQLTAREQAREAGERAEVARHRERILAHMAAEASFIEGLVNHPDDLMRLVGASGAAVVSQQHCWLLGRTPDEAQVRRLFDWLANHHREDVFETDVLGSALPDAAAYAGTTSGLLAISVSKMHASYVLWFRPEVVQTVNWGGDPTKPATQGGTGPARLNPRTSFDAWKETVQGRALPWRAVEVEAAKDLRNAVLGIVLRRAEEMAALTEELQRSNKELEGFCYSVSHDLRAPFRHVVGYAELLRTKGGELNERGRRYLDTIVESATSAGTLVDSLLGFSRFGRASLARAQIDMDALVADTRRHLMTRAGDRRIVWRVDPLLPVRADPDMMRAVVENLLSNAVKYTGTRAEAVIEVGCREEPGEVVYWVRDNGVGFDMAYVGKLFGVFQRLHHQDEFEGTGIGLANVRRVIAERHGGRVWADGAPDRGATFWLALPRSEGAQ